MRDSAQIRITLDKRHLAAVIYCHEENVRQGSVVLHDLMDEPCPVVFGQRKIFFYDLSIYHTNMRKTRFFNCMLEHGRGDG